MTTRASAQEGFTLIETILYISIFVIVIGAALIATYQMIKTSDNTQVKSLTHNEAQFSIRKFHWLLNGATSATVTGNTLNITNPELPGSGAILQLNGTHLSEMLNGTSYDLTGDISPVTQLTFTVNPAGSKPAEVQMVFRMQNAYYDETFTAKKLIR